MRFSLNLKKCLAGLMLGGLALWLAGCGESSSTPMPSSSTSNAASPRVNSDGSVKADGAADGKSASGSEGTESGAADEQAGSSTGGREVPEAAPPSDKDEAK